LTVNTWTSRPRNVDSLNSLRLSSKCSEDWEAKMLYLINYFDVGSTNPDILFFSQHHVKEQDLLLHITLLDEMFGCSFCCQNIQLRGVCIFVWRDLYFNRNIITKEKDSKVCAVEEETEASELTHNSYKVIWINVWKF